MFQDLVEADIYYGAIFEKQQQIDFNKNLFKDYPNKLCEFIPEFNKELYDMVKIFEFSKNKLEFYHDMKMMRKYLYYG